MFKCAIILIILLSTLFAVASTEIAKKNPKNQVEDIFIWKISDELQLSAKQEKEFGDIHRSLNKKKSEISEEIKFNQTDIRKNEKPLSKVEQTKLIQKNRQLLQKLNQLNMDEFDSMMKLLGSEKFLTYLFLKQEINIKFKSMVLGRQPEKRKDDDKIKATEPVVVEEK